MSELTLNQLRNAKFMLTLHEGCEPKMYWESLGKKWTVGIGRNMSDVPLRPSEIDLMFSNDMHYFHNYLSTNYEWYVKLNDARQLAILNMCFNMGCKGFEDFDQMILAFSRGDLDKAAHEIEDSDYGRHPLTKRRAFELANIVRTGSLNDFLKGRNLHGLLAA